jgi:hypothetical protein
VPVGTACSLGTERRVFGDGCPATLVLGDDGTK